MWRLVHSYSACGAPCRYWADIDTQLRRVGYEKRVKVRLLISCWASTQPVMFPFLKSLASVYDPKSKLDIQVVRSSSWPGVLWHWERRNAYHDAYSLEKRQTRWSFVSLIQRLFVVPANPKQKEIPFARVNHNKYMVTDKIAYIGEAAHSVHVVHVKHTSIPTPFICVNML